ncbi:uncharacterized protein LOC106135739 [Amyelois transitella]|uniref:uncharacterized protein LOC106135739 n=1 Tax=Amyelois transitella TaxID=680683 RepID=UPI00067ACB02|nr:uncharacterized protein LOC106135739 [Amyelois transitella]
MSVRFVLCLAVVAVALSGVVTLTPEEESSIRGHLREFVNECSKEYGISEEQLKTAKENKNVDGIEPCAIGCVYKKAKFINDQGLYDVDKAKEISAKYVNSEDDRKKFAEIADDCSAVNDESVSDGDKGCERAKLLLSCMFKHKDAIQV